MKYILGNGTFSIGATVIALTRGGGSFSDERTIKQVEADGDYGPVEGRIRIDGSMSKLTLRALDIQSTNMTKMYPGLDVDTAVSGTATVTGTNEIVTGDYTTVIWTGKTDTGDSVVITMTNAINLENIQWDMVDKDEIVAEVTYTGTYDEAARQTPRWSIDFVDLV